MKRSACAELERPTKRPRLDVQQEADLQGDNADVTSSPDFVPPVLSTLNPDYPMDLINATTSIHALPIEILGNHIFKFFDFEYWLISFVTVSKFWQTAAIQSTLDKQLRVSNPTGAGIIKRYRISTLIIEFDIDLPDIATLVNASPRICSVKLRRDINNFDWVVDLPPSAISKFSCNNVSTIYLSAYYVQLLKFFPKASRVCLDGGYRLLGNFTSYSVQEVALEEKSVTEMDFSLRETKTLFPAVKTIYFVVQTNNQQSQDEVRETLDALSEELGVSLIYKYWNSDTFSLSNFTYHEFFNVVGRTPFCFASRSSERLPKVFQQYPTLTLEYEQDFIARKPQFLFPHCTMLKSRPEGSEFKYISWKRFTEKDITLCYEKKMLPPTGLVNYYVKKNDYTSAVEVIKTHSLNVEHLSGSDHSLAQLRNYLGRDAAQFLHPELFRFNIVREAQEYMDLTPIKEIFSKDLLQNMRIDLLDKLPHNISIAQFQYLIQIDSWLYTSSRRVDDQSIGIQYLSDDGQAHYFARLLQMKDIKQIEKDLQLVSKPLHQIVHCRSIVRCKRDILTNVVTKFNYDLNWMDAAQETPLVYAITADFGRAIELLQLGADPNLAANTLLPLHYALKENHPPYFNVINALLMYGADISRRDYDSKGRTMWPITAAVENNAKAVKLLLDFGADPTVIDEAGNTLLHVPFRQAHYDVSSVVHVLAPHIDINRKNNLGDSALHCAIMVDSDPDVIAILIKYGADVNLPNAQGLTPLMLACRDPITLKAIIASNQVNIKARTKKGHTFIDFVFTHMQDSFADLLDNAEFLTACKPYLTDENIQFVKEECSKIITRSKYSAHKLLASHITIAKFLVDLGFDVAKHSYDLLKEIDLKKTEVVEFLLANGLDINATKSDQETVLNNQMTEDLVPITKKRAEKIQWLLKQGASLMKDSDTSIDPSMEARFIEGLHSDYFAEELPDVNLIELRKKKVQSNNNFS